MSSPSSDLRDALDAVETAERESRARIEATSRFAANHRNRETGYRALSAAKAMAHTMGVVPTLSAPRVHGVTSWHYDALGVGQNCPDFRYGVTPLAGAARYRLRGRMGGFKLGLVQVYDKYFGHPDARTIGNYDISHFAAADGTFDIAIGADVDPDEGIRLDGASDINFAIIRRIFADIRDDPGELTLAFDGSPALIAEDMAARLHRAADLIRFLAGEWGVGLYEQYIATTGGANKLIYVTSDSAASIGGNPSSRYGMGVYRVQPDEAVILELQPTEAAYWNVQIADVWSHSLDFVNHQTDINMTQATLDGDGRFRAVLCHTDPGVPNWVDLCGHEEGLVATRCFNGVEDTGAPVMRTVPLADLRAELPDDTPTVSAEARRATRDRRRHAFLNAYGE